MKALKNATEKTFFVARSDGGICHIGEIEPGQSFATGLRHCQLETNEQTHYTNMEAIAVSWELGLVLKPDSPPISHGGKLYKIVQGHTVNDPNHTPDIVPALYTEIQKPTETGYPEWVQKWAPPYYQIGDRVTHNGQNWECTAADGNGNNVWEPGVYGWVVI